MKQKHLALVFAFLLLLSISINFIQAFGTSQASMRGTFMCNDGTYLVFMPGSFLPATGLFMEYQTDTTIILEEGRYFAMGEGLYRLENREGTFVMEVLHSNDRVYMFEESGKIRWFSRVASTPLLLGVEFDESLLN